MERTVLCVAPPRLGGLDLLIPILCELKAQNQNTTFAVVIEDSRAYAAMQRSEVLAEAFERTVSKFWLIPSHERNERKLFGYLRRVIPFISVLLFAFVRRPRIFLHAAKSHRWLIWVLYKAVGICGGKTFVHPSIMGLPLTSDEHEEDKPAILADYRLAFRILPEVSPKNRTVSIGFPRLYPSWKKTVENHATRVRRELCRDGIASGNSALVAIFVSSVVEGVFGADDLMSWANDVADALDKHYPGAVLLVKPHPMLSGELLEKVISVFSQRILKTETHAGCLSAVSDVVVTSHSSTIIDALSAGVPTIGFQAMTKQWLARHTDGSRYMKLCSLRAGCEEELSGHLDTVRSGRYIPPDIESALGHVNDLSILKS